MVTDEFIHRQLRDILSRNPDATHPEIMDALAYRARLNWGRVPASIHLVQRGLDSAIDIARKYSPDQPRVPAGNSDGGQWTRDPNSSEGGREAREAAKPKVRAANTSEGGLTARERESRLLEDSKRPDSAFAALQNPDGSYVSGPTGEIVAYPRAFPPEFFVAQSKKMRFWEKPDFSSNYMQQSGLEKTYRSFSKVANGTCKGYSTNFQSIQSTVSYETIPRLQ